ncbi:hypothetical protein [Humibacillus xanthopallidus]|uniref:Uncharacterized protein n=1 Tax=Humibacillus xanthopallidus TaxID=412689 RepID=A0A543HW96_9MICO|nr:hypothetical protein [Humibacillus xanthopallidus]TQM62580.1 hypothetical protein FBY41_2616 [Humibacillus xanthopallidus]
MTNFRVTIVCDNKAHARGRPVDTFDYAQHRDSGEWRWFWVVTRKIGGGKRDPQTWLGEWMEEQPSHATVRDDFTDGVARVRLRCKGHAEVGMPWPEFVARYLEPCRENDVHSVPLQVIVSTRTNPTRRRDG